MEIRYVEEISSTHQILSNLIREDEIPNPLALYAGLQTGGVGSRGNAWEGKKGDLFLSFCLPVNSLPEDLPQVSASIYFSWIVLELLRSYGSKVCLKWPNDFYIEDKKLGGMITSKIKNFFIVSFGINFIPKKEYAGLDVNIDVGKFVIDFTNNLNILPSWKNIFSKYKVEFPFSQNFSANIDGERVSLKSAELLDDGSIKINNRRVYSLR